MRRTLTRVAFFLALFGAWQVLAMARLWSPVLFPAPTKVFAYLVDSISDGTLLGAAAVTARRLFTGYGIGLAVGLPMGVLTARSRTWEDTLGLLALGFQTLPSVCWVPGALLWFGASESAMLFVVVMGTVWSIAIAADGGIRSMPPIYARAARTMGSRRLHTWTHVVLPASLPFVLSGMKQGWAFAWRSLMAAEIYVPISAAIGLGNGLGKLLDYGRDQLAMDQVLGVIFVVLAIGLFVDRLLFAPAERYLHRRWGTGV